MHRTRGQDEIGFGFGEHRLRAGCSALVLTAALWLAIAAPDTAYGCYAVVVGREASADGSVLLGHNEQSGASGMTNLRVVPSQQYARGAEVRLLRGGRLPQVEQTHRVIWSNIPDQEFSDNYMNEWGVAVVSAWLPKRAGGSRRSDPCPLRWSPIGG